MPETKAPAPWDNPGVLPTDAAAQAAAEAAEQARQAALAAASTQGTTPAANGAPAAGAGPAGAVAVAGAAPEVASEVTVTAIVPRPITLRLSESNGTDVTHTEVKYNPGTQQMPLDHATHWWAKANGVRVYDPTVKP